jgi:hypothetical protein
VILIAGYPALSTLGRTVDFLVVSCGATVPVAWVVRRRPWWYLLAGLITLNLGNLAWY